MISSPPDCPIPKLRWRRFSLKTLMLVTALLALALGLGMNRFARQRKAVRSVRQAGGTVIYNLHEAGNAPWWKRQIVGEECLLSEKLTINLSGTHIGENVLIGLRGLPQVDTLYLVGAHVSDDEFRQIGELSNLRSLNLRDAVFNENELENVNDLDLVELQLEGTSITDRGLARLRPRGLRYLRLSGTRVTQQGVSQLQAILPKCSISWDDTAPYQPSTEPQAGGLGGATAPQ